MGIIHKTKHKEFYNKFLKIYLSSHTLACLDFNLANYVLLCLYNLKGSKIKTVSNN